MHRHKDAERTAYYRQEASACATAALTTAIAEIKQAYLDLEQGWLCLAPKVVENTDAATDPKTPHDADPKPSRAPIVNAVHAPAGATANSKLTFYLGHPVGSDQYLPTLYGRYI
jgi:hypothetical protein